jgi:hypothetical protein
MGRTWSGLVLSLLRLRRKPLVVLGLEVVVVWLGGAHLTDEIMTTADVKFDRVTIACQCRSIAS